jgi:uroporphyrinogen-III decarboxylase
MPRFKLAIDYPLEKMEFSRRRMEARNAFSYVDRVPILYGLFARYFTPLFQLRYIDFFQDPETHYYWQLQFIKYRMENIPEDFCLEPTIYVHPFFDNVIPPSGNGGQVGWMEDGPPRAIPIIKTVEEMERFEVAKPETGLRGKAIEWWLRMKEFAADTKLTFQGREGRVEMEPLALGFLSPHMIAIDLVGDNFYWWMLEYPEQCHRFLAKITQAEIDSEENTRRIDPRPRTSFALAEDSAQIMSPELFKRFCVPYDNILFERYGDHIPFGRTVHMCGNSTHLHKVLKEDLKMSSFFLFGYPVPPKVAAANLGGTTLLWGNVKPMLMKDGAYHEVKQAACECLEAIGPCGGLLLGDGANVCPGTPLASFHAIMEAAEEFGLGEGRLPRWDPAHSDPRCLAPVHQEHENLRVRHGIRNADREPAAIHKEAS